MGDPLEKWLRQKAEESTQKGVYIGLSAETLIQIADALASRRKEVVRLNKVVKREARHADPPRT